jgi:hypothetical protein
MASNVRREDPPPMSIVPSAPLLPQARLSPELEMLLGRAEQRVTQSRPSVAPPSDRLSPEAELEAILPNDVLAALDEPLDLDDSDDSDAGPSTHGGADDRGTGRSTNSGGTKTGQGTGSKAPAAGTASEVLAPGNAEEVHVEKARTEPPSRQTEPPKTPPAIPNALLRRMPSSSPRFLSTTRASAARPLVGRRQRCRRPVSRAARPRNRRRPSRRKRR